MLLKLKQEEDRREYTIGAWIGFQMGAGSGRTFGQYLDDMGLGEEQVEAAPKTRDLTAEEAIAKAESILAMAAKKDKEQ